MPSLTLLENVLDLRPVPVPTPCKSLAYLRMLEGLERDRDCCEFRSDPLEYNDDVRVRGLGVAEMISAISGLVDLFFA